MCVLISVLTVVAVLFVLTTVALYIGYVIVSKVSN